MTESISLKPGPPFEPLYRITTMCPSFIFPFDTASKASSSESKVLVLRRKLLFTLKIHINIFQFQPNINYGLLLQQVHFIKDYLFNSTC